MEIFIQRSDLYAGHPLTSPRIGSPWNIGEVFEDLSKENSSCVCKTRTYQGPAWGGGSRYEVEKLGVVNFDHSELVKEEVDDLLYWLGEADTHASPQGYRVETFSPGRLKSLLEGERVPGYNGEPLKKPKLKIELQAELALVMARLPGDMNAPWWRAFRSFLESKKD